MGDLLEIVLAIKALVIQFIVSLFKFKITIDWYGTGKLYEVPVMIIILYFMAWVLALSFIWILFTNKVNRKLGTVSEEEE